MKKYPIILLCYIIAFHLNKLKKTMPSTVQKLVIYIYICVCVCVTCEY